MLRCKNYARYILIFSKDIKKNRNKELFCVPFSFFGGQILQLSMVRTSRGVKDYMLLSLTEDFFGVSHFTACEEEEWQHSQPVIVITQTFTIKLNVPPSLLQTSCNI